MPGEVTARRVVVITGASAGLGRAITRRFAAEGACLGLIAREPARLEATTLEVEQSGGRALALPGDVADAKHLEMAAQTVEEAFGPIDVWVNNAMSAVFAPVSETTAEEFLRVTEVTYLGAVYGTQAALRRMLPRDRGSIVQVGSALAYRSIPLQAPYCGAKSALRGFTDSLRSELIHHRSGIHLTMVHLSAFNTPQFDWARNRTGKLMRPLGTIYQPELAAEAIYWAARHRRREVWVGFPAVKAILGTRIIPGLLDWWLAFRAYDGQKADEPVPERYEDNLDDAVRGDHHARGRFSDVARSFSAQFALNRRLPAVVIASLAALLALAVWLNGLAS